MQFNKLERSARRQVCGCRLTGSSDVIIRKEASHSASHFVASKLARSFVAHVLRKCSKQLEVLPFYPPTQHKAHRSFTWQIGWQIWRIKTGISLTLGCVLWRASPSSNSRSFLLSSSQPTLVTRDVAVCGCDAMWPFVAGCSGLAYTATKQSDCNFFVRKQCRFILIGFTYFRPVFQRFLFYSVLIELICHLVSLLHSIAHWCLPRVESWPIKILLKQKNSIR